MHPRLHEFAEFVGRCLAHLWLRERDESRGQPTPLDTPTGHTPPRSSSPAVPSENALGDRQESAPNC